MSIPPLPEARWPEIDRAERDLLLLPIGALEQHGPHLPLDTDAVIAGEIARRVQARRPRSGLAPTVPYGSSGEHADFPGTLSIGNAALSLLVVELVRDASRYWRGVLVINGHGGNLVALNQARDTCDYERRHLEIVHLALPGMDAHAGQAETSMMLAVAPHRVRLELAEAGPSEPVERLWETLRREGVRVVSPNGVLGDPRSATAALGATMLESLTAKALRAHDRHLGDATD